MSAVAIVTDSTADLPVGLAASRSIEVVPLTVFIEGTGYRDGVDITPEQFYERQAGLQALPTTSQPSPAAFAQAYERLLKDHEEVVSIHISEKLSGTYAAARQGAELVDAARIHVVDSQTVSMPLGLLVLGAAAAAARDADAFQIVNRLETLRTRVGVYFVVATLENLRRGGRIGRASALLGSVLQVKPVLTIQDGQVAPLERVRTYERALSRVVELARAVDNGSGICAIVGHASAPDAAKRIAEELEPISESLLIQPLGPVVGAHAGAGTVGVGCYPAELYPLGLKASLTRSASS